MKKNIYAFTITVLSVLSLVAQEWKSTRADIYLKKGKPYLNVLVLEESVKNIKWGKTEGQWGSMSRSTILRVDYTASKKNLAQARGKFNSRRYEKAIEAYKKTQAFRIQSIQIFSAQGIADSYIAMGKYEEALKTLQDLISKNATWPYLLDIVRQKGSLEIKTKKYSEAINTFKSIKNMSPEFGKLKDAYSFLGLAEVETAQGKTAVALPLLKKAFGLVTVERSPSLYGEIALCLADNSIKNSDKTAALKYLNSVSWLPLPDDTLSRAHLSMAKIKLSEGDLASAFEEAAVSAIIPSPSSAAYKEARSLLSSIKGKIEKSTKFTPEQKLAYREAYSKL